MICPPTVRLASSDWRGPAATQAMGHVFFPRAPLSLDLPQVDVVLIPGEKKSERSEIRGRKILKDFWKVYLISYPNLLSTRDQGTKCWGAPESFLLPFALQQSYLNVNWEQIHKYTLGAIACIGKFYRRLQKQMCVPSTDTHARLEIFSIQLPLRSNSLHMITWVLATWKSYR